MLDTKGSSLLSASFDVLTAAGVGADALHSFGGGLDVAASLSLGYTGPSSAWFANASISFNVGELAEAASKTAFWLTTVWDVYKVSRGRTEPGEAIANFGVGGAAMIGMSPESGGFTTFMWLVLTKPEMFEPLRDGLNAGTLLPPGP